MLSFTELQTRLEFSASLPKKTILRNRSIYRVLVYYCLKAFTHVINYKFNERQNEDFHKLEINSNCK